MLKVGPYPNRLSELRMAAFVTRAQLAELTSTLAAEDASLSPVSARTLERLERGETRPRVRIAAALAKALGVEAAVLFPLGADDAVRNPRGHTRITPGRTAPGRPPKST